MSKFESIGGITFSPTLINDKEETHELHKRKEAGGGEHPDWNQNDPTAPDYVKNRPFSKKISYGDVYYKKQEVTVFYDNYHKPYVKENPDLLVYPDVGGTAEIRINDKQYHVDMDSYEGYPGCEIGDTTCPVSMWIDGMIYLNEDVVYEGYTFTFEMVQTITEIKTIPPEFIEPISIEKGGTGATNANDARIALGIAKVSCETASGAAVKEITLPGYKKYGFLCVNFMYANSASAPKLKINNDPAWDIYNFKTLNKISSEDIGKSVHLFVFFDNTWYLLNPKS